MALPRSKLTSQGQVSIPADVRRKLGLDPGAVIEWEEEPDGRVVVRRAGRFTSEDIHRELFADTAAKTASISELDEGIRRHVRSRRARG